MQVVEVGVPSTTKHYVFSLCIIFKLCYGNCNVILTTAYFELQSFLQLNVQFFKKNFCRFLGNIWEILFRYLLLSFSQRLVFVKFILYINLT